MRSVDLALADWLERRSYPGDEIEVDELLAAKRTSVSLVLPAREVASTIGPIVDVAAGLRDRGLIDELLVVDADSADGTASVAAARGATVARESELMTGHGPALGKGDALWRGLAATSGEVVVFCDTDTADFSPRFLLGLLAPMLSDPSIALVKGAFRRPLRVGGLTEVDGGGRVTELVARPLLNLHRPALAGFAQPLAGEVAARRELLEGLAFPVGYGVEIATLLDAHALAGLDALAQVDLGSRQNRHQPLRELRVMAYQVLVAAARRTGDAAALETAAPGPLVVPSGSGGLDVRAVAVEERPPLAGVDAAATRAATG